MVIARHDPSAYAPPKTFVEQFPALPEAVCDVRNAVAEFARTQGASPALVEDVRLAVSEAATNVVVHAYPGRTDAGFRVLATVDGRQLLVVIEDDGRGLNARSPHPGLGAGLGIMRQIADEARFVERQHGSTVQLRFGLR